jgi:hypothetical protein
MSPEKIAKLRELLAKATPGPWTFPNLEAEYTSGFEFYGRDDEKIMGASGHWSTDEPSDDDARLIVEAINALPELLDAVAPVEPAGEP